MTIHLNGRIGGDLTTIALNVRRDIDGVDRVIFTDSVTVGTLFRAFTPNGVVTGRTTSGTRRRNRPRHEAGPAVTHVADYEPIAEPLYAWASTYYLEARVGDVIVGDISGRDLPERIRVTRVLAGDTAFYDAVTESTIRAAIYEGVATSDPLSPTAQEVREAAARAAQAIIALSSAAIIAEENYGPGHGN